MKRIKEFFAGNKVLGVVGIIFALILLCSVLFVAIKKPLAKDSLASRAFKNESYSDAENSSSFGPDTALPQEKTTAVTSTDYNDVTDISALSGSSSPDETKADGANMTPPASKAEILAFYKKAVDRISEKGEAGYKKKAWRTLESVDTKHMQSDMIFRSVAKAYLVSEADAREEAYAKGSKAAKESFPACAMTDDRFIQDARCEVRGENYYITLVVKDDDTPRKNRNHLGQITSSLLHWEDISGVIKKIKMIESIDESKTHIYYDNFTITSVITKSGEFISLTHSSNVYVTAAGTVHFIKYYDVNIDAHFKGQSNYYGFQY